MIPLVLQLWFFYNVGTRIIEESGWNNMKIDFNETECRAMQAFLEGNNDLGEELQAEFLNQLKEAMKNGQDHCPCTADCSIHGKCFICVQVHRGHGNHLPACMHEMVNRKLKELSELTEHSIIDEVEKPIYLK